MARQEANQRKLAKLEAQGKRCNGLTLTRDGHLEPCLLSATLEENGEKYCHLHYPPHQIERAEKSKQALIARYERELERLRKMSRKNAV